MIIMAIRSFHLHRNFDQVCINAPANREINMLTDGRQVHNITAASSNVMVQEEDKAAHKQLVS